MEKERTCLETAIKKKNLYHKNNAHSEINKSG